MPKSLLSYYISCHTIQVDVRQIAYQCQCTCTLQWRRQDLLRGGAKLEIMSWGTHGGLEGRVQQRLED